MHTHDTIKHRSRRHRAPSPPPASEQAALRPTLAGKLVLTAMFWGGTFIAGRVLAQAMPLMSAAFCRFLVAAVLLVLVAKSSKAGRCA